MPVGYIKADMLAYPLQTITNTVNCVGAMGKGLALQFKRQFPMYNDDYVQRCSDEQVKTGKPYIFEGPYGLPAEVHPWILSFPTKDHWKDKSKLIWIEDGLDYVVANYERWGITSLGMPKLGCGLGGLGWPEVKRVMEAKLSKMDIITLIYV